MSKSVLKHVESIQGMEVHRVFITSDSIDEIYSHLMDLVRPCSREFYNREILKDLNTHGVAFGDSHAFSGVQIYGILKGSSLKEMSEHVKSIYKELLK